MTAEWHVVIRLKPRLYTDWDGHFEVLSANACGHPVFEDCVRLCYQTIAENGGQFVPDSWNWSPKFGKMQLLGFCSLSNQLACSDGYRPWCPTLWLSKDRLRENYVTFMTTPGAYNDCRFDEWICPCPCCVDFEPAFQATWALLTACSLPTSRRETQEFDGRGGVDLQGRQQGKVKVIVETCGNDGNLLLPIAAPLKE